MSPLTKYQHSLTLYSLLPNKSWQQRFYLSSSRVISKAKNHGAKNRQRLRSKRTSPPRFLLFVAVYTGNTAVLYQMPASQSQEYFSPQPHCILQEVCGAAQRGCLFGASLLPAPVWFWGRPARAGTHMTSDWEPCSLLVYRDFHTYDTILLHGNLLILLHIYPKAIN